MFGFATTFLPAIHTQKALRRCSVFLLCAPTTVSLFPALDNLCKKESMDSTDSHKPKRKSTGFLRSFWHGTLISTCLLIFVGVSNISQVSWIQHREQTNPLQISCHRTFWTRYCHGISDEIIESPQRFAHAAAGGKLNGKRVFSITIMNRPISFLAWQGRNVERRSSSPATSAVSRPWSRKLLPTCEFHLGDVDPACPRFVDIRFRTYYLSPAHCPFP